MAKVCENCGCYFADREDTGNGLCADCEKLYAASVSDSEAVYLLGAVRDTVVNELLESRVVLENFAGRNRADLESAAVFLYDRFLANAQLLPGLGSLVFDIGALIDWQAAARRAFEAADASREFISA